MTQRFAPEIITVPNHSDNVMCDGGHGALGHPATYYSFGNNTIVQCKYCDRVFVHERDVHKLKNIS